MIFDPEKVHVWTYNYDSSDRSGDVSSTTSPESVRDGDEFVLRSDYDQLLALWRNQKQEILECYESLGMV